MKIKTGDKVKVLSGKDRGKTGKVVQVLKNKKTNQSFVVVEDVNMLKKHMKPGRKNDKGQIIELPAPINISNVMLLDPSSGKPTRVGYKQEGEDKKRIAKVSGEFIN
jgi:large subunit ribosomal protein L24